MSRESGCVIGLNIGRTYLAIGVADPNGRLLSAADTPDRSLTGDAKKEAWDAYRHGQAFIYPRRQDLKGRKLLNLAAKRMLRLLELLEVPNEEIRGIALSVPAPVSAPRARLLTHSIEGGLANLGNIERVFIEILREGFGREDSFTRLEKVILANDADVAARGEVRYGKAYRKQDVVVIHAAYGIGAGVITEGNVLRTGAGGGVGEVGHCVPHVSRDEGKRHGLVPLDPENDLYHCACDHSGHLEALAGGDGIVRRLAASRKQLEGDPPPPTLDQLLLDTHRDPARTLDALFASIPDWRPGLEAVLDAAHLIGGAAHSLAHLFKPEAIYVSGKLSEVGDQFIQMVREGFTHAGSLQNYEPPIELGQATTEFDRRRILVMGAAMTAVRATAPLVSREDLELLELGGNATALSY